MNEISTSEGAIDHKKKEMIDKASIMDRVPLVHLHILIKQRRQQALAGYAEGVEHTNKKIMLLLGI